MLRGAIVLSTAVLAGAASGGPSSYVNWESPHINPLDITPDGSRLLAVNTADARLEVFAIENGTVRWEGSVAVGLDPVSVRARTDQEAWVANHISDTISVVDLSTLTVKATLPTGDEPTDVVFAGSPQRAFVSVSQLNQVKVFDPLDLGAPPLVIDIEGEDPRALATDGTRVYAAIFESGNRTTILDHTVVSSNLSPYAGHPNPPPNDGAGFSPPLNPLNPMPLPAGIIVKKDPDGAWRDDNGGDWSAAVTWDLHDHDVAVIDADTLGVTYVTGLMNLDANLAVGPSGDVVVIGTDAINHVRFEPNLNGTFVRVIGARFTPPATLPSAVVDLNPHLDYMTPSVSAELRQQSLGDPRGVAWNAAGDRVYVTGLGSNNLAAFDADLNRVGLAEVGQGPTGVRVDDARGLIYVLNHFEAAISVVDAGALSELHRVSFHDATPVAIREGRPFLYDTHAHSGLGQASCGSCHLSGRTDQIAWDLGDPSGSMIPFFDQTKCNFGFGGCEPWHPLKGPLMTQTLLGSSGTGRLHWRGDRATLVSFNVAFVGLLGADSVLTGPQMVKFQAFANTLTLPPNPNRDIHNGLKPVLENGFSPPFGEFLFQNIQFDSGVTCVGCHTMPLGTDTRFVSGVFVSEPLSLKNPHMRTLYEKTGFDNQSLSSNRGFGFTHDGSVSTVVEFLSKPSFNFAPGQQGDDDRRHLEAFLVSLSTDTHAGIGVQVTLPAPGLGPASLRDEMIAVALESNQVGLIAKGLVDGIARGYAYDEAGGLFLSDRSGESLSLEDLDAISEAGFEITYTLVPEGAATRLGIDRDEDGALDRDELDACAHPGDPAVVPGSILPACCAAVCEADPACCANGWDASCQAQADKLCLPCTGDVTGDSVVDVLDLVQVVLSWGPCPRPPTPCPADVMPDGVIDVQDLVDLVVNWGPCF